MEPAIPTLALDALPSAPTVSRPCSEWERVFPVGYGHRQVAGHPPATGLVVQGTTKPEEPAVATNIVGNLVGHEATRARKGTMRPSVRLLVPVS